MDDLSIAKLSLIGSFCGLFLLFIALTFIEPPETNIKELQEVENNDVRISGKVIAIKNFDNLAVVELAEISTVNIIVFDKKLLNFIEGDNIRVDGELRDYKGKKEIIAEKIKVKDYVTNR